MTNIIQHAKRRSKKKERDFDFDVEYLVELYKKQKGKCYYSGRELKYNMAKKDYEEKRINPDRLTIDRIDSNIGYKKDNIVLSTWVANNMKQDLNVEEFKRIITEIYSSFVVPL